MEDRTFQDRDVEHLFQAERLGTKLDIVVIPAAVSPPFVLDRVWDLRTWLALANVHRGALKFNQIGTPIET
jgi:hypothetical protein